MGKPNGNGHVLQLRRGIDTPKIGGFWGGYVQYGLGESCSLPAQYYVWKWWVFCRISKTLSQQLTSKQEWIAWGVCQLRPE